MVLNRIWLSNRKLVWFCKDVFKWRLDLYSLCVYFFVIICEFYGKKFLKKVIVGCIGSGCLVFRCECELLMFIVVLSFLYF